MVSGSMRLGRYRLMSISRRGTRLVNFAGCFAGMKTALGRYSCRLTEEWLLDPFHDLGRCAR